MNCSKVKLYVPLAIFMAILFIVKDITTMVFYFYPDPFHQDLIFTKHMLVSLDIGKSTRFSYLSIVEHRSAINDIASIVG